MSGFGAGLLCGVLATLATLVLLCGLVYSLASAQEGGYSSCVLPSGPYGLHGRSGVQRGGPCAYVGPQDVSVWWMP